MSNGGLTTIHFPLLQGEEVPQRPDTEHDTNIFSTRAEFPVHLLRRYSIAKLTKRDSKTEGVDVQGYFVITNYRIVFVRSWDSTVYSEEIPLGALKFKPFDDRPRHRPGQSPKIRIPQLEFFSKAGFVMVILFKDVKDCYTASKGIKLVHNVRTEKITFCELHHQALQRPNQTLERRIQAVAADFGKKHQANKWDGWNVLKLEDHYKLHILKRTQFKAKEKDYGNEEEEDANSKPMKNTTQKWVAVQNYKGGGVSSPHAGDTPSVDIPTYPGLIFVPKKSLELLRQMGTFRSKGRIPVLAWIDVCGVSITRSSQPLRGLREKSDKNDEQHLENIKELSGGHSMTVVDARPWINVVANIAGGGGTEGEALCMNVENIHVMRESLEKVFEMARSPGGNYMMKLNESKWLLHCRLVLEASIRIVQEITLQHNVLVHCSDGWDRTAQLVALAELMLDPYYRKILGFMRLIEKEWCCFGHKFAERCGAGYPETHLESERSPVFHQFIECVWQILLQFPTKFEFNETLLLIIMEHLYSNRFGTFLSNCYRDREEMMVKTTSLWTYVMGERLGDITNHRYDKRDEPGADPIIPLCNSSTLKLWTNYYFQNEPLVKQRNQRFAECRRKKAKREEERIRADKEEERMKADKDEEGMNAEKEEEGMNAGNSDTLNRPHKEQSPRHGTIV